MISPSLAIIRIGIDPVIHIAALSVHWYGVMYAIAFLVAFRFGVLPHVVPRGLDRGLAERMLVWTIVFGLLGGRLYYVVQQPHLGDYLRDPIRIIAVWEGGMAFFGAIIAGLATITVLALRHRVAVWLAWDAGVIFAVVGQPIGRIGNIINGDILGAPSTLPWATAYTNPHAILQAGFSLCTPAQCVAYQPAAAYEALGTIVIGCILFAMRRRGVRAGALAVAYIPLYALSQLVLFQFRKSEPVLLFGLHQAQLTAIVMLVLVTPVLVVVWRRTAPAPDVSARGPSPHHDEPAEDAASADAEPTTTRAGER